MCRCARSPFVNNWLPVIIWAAAILVMTSLPRLPRTGIENGDKWGHLVAYGGLGVLLVRALRISRRMPEAPASALTMLGGGLFGVLDELHQIPLPHRTASIEDWVADLGGLALATATAYVWPRIANIRTVRIVNGRERETMAEALHLKQDSFDGEVVKSDLPALVDFWAPWCGPCQMMGPAIDKLAGDYAGRAKIVKVNVDDSPELASKYGIRSIPALLFFKGGEVVDQLIGVQPEAVLSQKLDGLV